MLKQIPILSIVIPTYNRAHILDKCLKLITDLAIIYKKDIEILVSDNCSSDNTEEIIEARRLKIVRYSDFFYFKNSKNLGVAKNIISLFKKAKGRYILFLGDDDYIKKKNFSRILKLLTDDRSPSAIIQGCWNGVMRTHKTGFVSYKYASELFYEYGNTYAGIVDRKAILDILTNNNQLSKDIEKIVWPQTVLGFLVINQLKKRPIYITDFEIGDQIQSLNITNKEYWVKSLYGLLRASFLIDKQIGKNWTKKKFIRFKSKGFMDHAKAIVYYSLIAENTESSQVQKEFRSNYGLRGCFWFIIFFFLDRFPKIYLWIGIIVYAFIYMKSPKFIFKKFLDKKTRYEKKLEEIKKTKKNFKDWF